MDNRAGYLSFRSPSSSANITSMADRLAYTRSKVAVLDEFSKVETIDMIGVMPEPAAIATKWPPSWDSSSAIASGLFSAVVCRREVNEPCGFITLMVSQTASSSWAQVEKNAPQSYIIATRISPGTGSAQME